METDNTAFLMDGVAFLEELENSKPRPRPGMVDVSSDALRAFKSEREVQPVHPTTAPRFMMPVLEAEPMVEAAPTPAMPPVLASVGFVLMMSIGAGAAALVFHDRVIQIVSQWNGGH